ncbi:ribonuclease H1-like [Schistocerca gregaria]|uniref:ribonuclease H1-like n=1 Tax=Schistocerca gregaria TaxID=7010 RepID=UPI00211DF59D|nr:ribonuclease H1-like [Schistocerca gregaria]
MIKLTSFVEKFWKNMSYYAVAKGRYPGVYSSWSDCKKQVDQFPGAKYRKFSTEVEARNFVSQFCTNSSHPTTIKREILSRSPYTTDEIANIYVEAISNAVKHRADSGVAADQHNNEEKATVSDIYKRLSQLEEKQDEITKRIREELDELRENFQALDSRLSKMESKIFDKSDVDHVVIKSRLDDINKVEKIFEEEFGLLREKIINLKAQKTELVPKDNGTESRRQLLKEILYEETKPKVLGNRPSGSKSASVSSSIGGAKRKYSTQSTEVNSVKQPKLDSSEDQKVASVSTLNSRGNLSSNSAFIVNSEGYVEVYTDGACEKNGKKGAKAGIGVWFGDSHPLNISEPVVGRPTNNTAEIQAATYAVETAKKAGVKKLLVHTDSNFLISCITQWIKKWKKNDWRVQGGEPVKNKDDLIVLDNKLQGIDVKWNHVRGHCGLHGNEMADRLAREGAKRYVQFAYDEDFDDLSQL